MLPFSAVDRGVRPILATLKLSARGPLCWLSETSVMAIPRSSSGAAAGGEVGVGEAASTAGEIRATALLVGTAEDADETASLLDAGGGGVDFSSTPLSAER